MLVSLMQDVSGIGNVVATTTVKLKLLSSAKTDVIRLILLYYYAITTNVQ